MNKKALGAIILAAGQGKRMKTKSINKVVFPIAKKPMILHTVELLETLPISEIVVVVGFAKDSVIKALKSKSVVFVEQKKRLGTARAVLAGLEKLPLNKTDVLVLQGDDSALYTQEVINKLIHKHVATGSSMTFLTLVLDNPSGNGRVVRDEDNKVVAIVEEKDATGAIRKIKEVNPALYIFKVSFLNKFLKKIKKSDITGEYYLTSVIDIAIKNKEHIETLQEKTVPWRGINTPQDLQEAERLFASRI